MILKLKFTKAAIEVVVLSGPSFMNDVINQISLLTTKPKWAGKLPISIL